jgi:hypothetical protein
MSRHVFVTRPRRVELTTPRRGIRPGAFATAPGTVAADGTLFVI